MEQKIEHVHAEGHAGKIVMLEVSGDEWFSIEGMAAGHVLLKSLQSGLLQMHEIETITLYLVDNEALRGRFGSLISGEQAVPV